MSLDANLLNDDFKEKYEYPCNIPMDPRDISMSESEEKEFIDIETIPICDVTSTTDKVMTSKL